MRPHIYSEFWNAKTLLPMPKKPWDLHGIRISDFWEVCCPRHSALCLFFQRCAAIKMLKAWNFRTGRRRFDIYEYSYSVPQVGRGNSLIACRTLHRCPYLLWLFSRGALQWISNASCELIERKYYSAASLPGKRIFRVSVMPSDVCGQRAEIIIYRNYWGNSGWFSRG